MASNVKTIITETLGELTEKVQDEFDEKDREIAEKEKQLQYVEERLNVYTGIVTKKLGKGEDMDLFTETRIENVKLEEEVQRLAKKAEKYKRQRDSLRAQLKEQPDE
ncbi:hypothetical protein HDE_03313 [Halotydeus destructor]|nr:hypothetical protein HDE_03313 [Halotydeus destructor]